MIIEDEAAAWTKEFGKEISDAMIEYICTPVSSIPGSSIYPIFKSTRLCRIASIYCGSDSLLVHASRILHSMTSGTTEIKEGIGK